MPINYRKWPFVDEIISNTPGIMGVYALWRNNELIYYGKSEGGSTSIRSRLQDHKAGREGTCTQAATHYQYEPNRNPKFRESELLEEHKMAYGDYPRCNERGT